MSRPAVGAARKGTKMSEPTDCYQCGGTMQRIFLTEMIECEGMKAEVEESCHSCPDCGAKMATGRDMALTAEHMAELKRGAEVPEESG